MSLAGEGMWDPQQREWLQAMGHSLLVLAADEPDEAPAMPSAEQAETELARGTAPHGSAAAARAPIESKPPSRPRPTPPPPADEPDAPMAPSRPRTDPAAKLAALEAARRAGAARNASGPLGEALLRATAQSPAAAARMLRELAVDPAALRDDPAAKRVLWARLRTLRKAVK
ncbi:hypothetical protein [Novilysobacter erysipheiresistens]|uniref:Alanine acetyltransferase n=1 Tax=Novilysobacter erysipheiresistens TaxID=1749332 RepID=A0ABU7YYS2_9GAMM